MSKRGKKKRRIRTSKKIEEELAAPSRLDVVKRHPVIAAIIAILGAVASIATIYSVMDPELVAISDASVLSTTEYSKTGRAVPGGVVVTLHGAARFENTSFRGGAFVKDVRFVIKSVDEALHPHVKLLHVSNELFAGRENKIINFEALVYFDVIGPGQTSPISLEVEFIDKAGGLINDKATGKPYKMTYRSFLEGDGKRVPQGVDSGGSSAR